MSGRETTGPREIEVKPEPIAPPVSSGVSDWDRLERARKWLLHAEPAVSGQSGYARTFAVCAVITRGFDLDEASAFALLSSWNEACCPPWDVRTLKRTIREARANSRLALGNKLENRKQDSRSRHTAAGEYRS